MPHREFGFQQPTFNGKKYKVPTDRLEELMSQFGRGIKGLFSPIEPLVNTAHELDAPFRAKTRRELNIPEDFPETPGPLEALSEQITPFDIATAGGSMIAKSLKPGAKGYQVVEEALKYADPMRSEIGAVGRDINQAPKGKLVLDNDLVGANPRSIGTNPRAQGKNPRALFENLDAGEGFTGRTSSKTKTFGLQGPKKEKLGGKIHDDKIELTSLGKGDADDSRSSIEALRRFSKAQNKPVYLDSSNFSQSGGKWLDRMVERGDLIKTDNGYIFSGTGEPVKKLGDTIDISPPNKPPNNKFPKRSKGDPPNPPDEPEKKATLAQNILGLPKTLKSTIDLPALRQSVVPSLTHPIKVGWPSIKAGMKSEFGPKRMYDEVLSDIGSRANAPIYKEYKMAIPDVGIRQEYPSGWAEQLEDKLGIAGPVTRSERGYDATMKTARSNLADLAIDQAQQQFSGDIPESEYKGIANFVNDFTGYGRLGSAERAADLLAAPFYSPRMIASRAQMLNPWNYTFGSRWGDVGKSMAQRDMGKFLGGTAGGLAAIDYLTPEDSPVSVEADPRSSDFGSVRANNTTFDLSGGLKPMVNLVARGVTGRVKSSRDDERVFDVPRGDTVGRFVRSKLAPGIPAMTVDALFGNQKDFVGRPINRSYESGPLSDIPYLPWMAEQVTPMYPSDVAETFEQSGPEVGSIAAGLGMLGAGSTSYDRTPVSKKKFSNRKKIAQKR